MSHEISSPSFFIPSATSLFNQIRVKIPKAQALAAPKFIQTPSVPTPRHTFSIISIETETIQCFASTLSILQSPFVNYAPAIRSLFTGVKKEDEQRLTTIAFDFSRRFLRPPFPRGSVTRSWCARRGKCQSVDDGERIDVGG